MKLSPPEMITILAGTFMMGTEENHEDEKPAHEIFLASYQLAKYPLTNAEYVSFIEAGGYGQPEEPRPVWWNEKGWQWRCANSPDHPKEHPAYWDRFGLKRPAHPVVGVTWYEALAYTQWLSLQMHKEYRLPTEVEWERAAQGPEGWDYPWGNRWDAAKANTYEGGVRDTTQVGHYQAGTSAEGLFDMSGNVWEWCSTQYQPYPYNAEDGREELTTLEDIRRSTRGGSWGSGFDHARTKFRGHRPADFRAKYLSFRLASSIK